MASPLVFGKRTISKVAAKKLEIRNKLWPSLNPARLWDRKTKVGFVTIPRALPLVLGIMDDMAKNQPVSRTYFDLWCHAYDDAFVIIAKPLEHAFASGFSGQRALASWSARVKLLVELKFIDVKPGASGPLHYVLIWNPFEVIKQHHEAGTPGLTEQSWNSLQQRLIDVGANDLTEVIATVGTAAV